jgi:hypothetical protein
MFFTILNGGGPGARNAAAFFQKRFNTAKEGLI